MAANGTGFVSYHELADGDLTVAGIETVFRFFHDRPPKVSARWIVLADIPGDISLSWVIVTKDHFVRSGGTSVPFGGILGLVALPSGSDRAEVGPSRILNGSDGDVVIEWLDAPRGSRAFAGRLDVAAGPFYGLVLIFPPNTLSVDPTLLVSPSTSTASAYSSQRKVVWDGRKFWVFYSKGSSIGYMNSVDGRPGTWSQEATLSISTSTSGFDVDLRGTSIVVGWYDGPILKFQRGTLYTDLIVWNAAEQVGTHSVSPPASVAIAADGSFWIAGERVYRFDGTTWVDKTFADWTGKPTANSAVMLLPLQGTKGAVNLDGWMFALLNFYPAAGVGELLAGLYNASSGAWYWEYFDPAQATNGVARHQTISAIAMGSIVDVVYSSAGTDASVIDVRHLQVGLTASITPFSFTDVRIGSTSETGPFFPTVAWAPPGGLYAYWRARDGGEWAVRGSTLRTPVSTGGPSWANASTVLPITPGQNPKWVSAPKVLLNRVALVWTDEISYPCGCSLWFGSLLLYDDFGGSSSHPWSRSGIAGQVPLVGEVSDFLNPSNGQLSIKQIDVEAPGRGLSLTMSRIHVNPFAFQGVTPLLYETNPTVPMGLGWEINLPWISEFYVHLTDGQRYSVARSADKFENQVGTPFTLYWRNPGYDLYLSDDSLANFDSSGKLQFIRDSTGSNMINFAYDANVRLQTITDTIGRIASFVYYSSGSFSGKLQSLSYAGRTITFDYETKPNGDIVLLRTTYPLGLQTTYAYDASSNYLVSSVTQPWGAVTSYTYTSAPVGTEATGYLVTQQTIKDGAVTVRSRSFDYVLANGWALATRVTLGDGTYAKGYESLTFASSTLGMTTIVKDATGKQMGKSVQWFGGGGTVGQTDVYLGDASNVNYSNVVAVDEWNNPHYQYFTLAKDVVHETFAAFGNTKDGNKFRSPGVIEFVSDGKVLYETFDQGDLYYWSLTAVGGATIALDPTERDRAPRSLKFTQTGSGTAIGYRYFAETSGEITFTTSIRMAEVSKKHYVALEQTNTIRAELLFDSDALIKWRVPGGAYENLQGYAANTWYRIQVEVNIGVSPAAAAIFINGVSYTKNAYQPGPVNRARFELQAGATNMWVGQVVLAKAGLGGSNRFLSFRLSGLGDGQKVELRDPFDALVWTGTAVWNAQYGSAIVDVVTDRLTFQSGIIRVFNYAGVAEHTSPSREFWPGSVYRYDMPYTYTGTTYFYSNNLGTNIHNRLVGTLQFQNGRKSATPVVQESYAQYSSSGLLTAAKVIHRNGGAPVALETLYTRDTYGNVIEVRDVQGKIVRYDFGPQYEFAYLTRG